MKKRKLGRKLLAFLLTLAMVVGLMPGMGMTAYAADSTVSDATALSNALSASENGTITLGSDIQISSTLSITGTKTLDLNGYGIKMTANSSVISVGSDANLTIKDSDTSRTHKFTLPNGTAGLATLDEENGTLSISGGYITGGKGAGGGVCVNSGNFTMTGGTIIGNMTNGTNQYGGGVCVNGGHFEMTGGAIMANQATGNYQYGGGVCVNGGHFEMTGGAIKKNNAGYGGGVDVRSNGQFVFGGTACIQENISTIDGSGINIGSNGIVSITGGTITENSTTANGAIAFRDGGKSLSISGSPVISNNINNNIYLYSNKKITVSGELSNTTPIGVTMKTLGAFTNSSNPEYNDPTRFSADNPNQIIGKDANGQLLMGSTSNTVTVTPSSNMTKTTDSGEASQTVVTNGVMTNVVYTADEGYYFPTDYSVATVNGIKVDLDSYTQITVSGTPTANATITLTAPTAKTTPGAPTTVTATNCTTSENNDGKLTGVTTAMEYKKSDAESWTAGTSSDITGLVPGTYYVRVKATDTTLASDKQELKITGYVASNYTVTYKVVNGTWSDDSTADKTETVQSGSKPASVPTGMKASNGYTGGAWDTNPAEATITGTTTFTYTYVAKEASVVTKDSLSDSQKPSGEDKTYTGSAITLLDAPSELPEGYTKAFYKLNGQTEWSETIPSETDPGTYTINVKYTSDIYEDLVLDDMVVKIEPVSKDGLNAAIGEAQTYLDEIGTSTDYNEIKQELSNAISSAQTVADNDTATASDVTTAINSINLAVDKAKYGVYKVDKKQAADELAQTGDSDACTNLITAAKTSIDEKAYDEDKTLAQNTAAIDAVITRLTSDLTDQRAADAVMALIDAIPAVDSITTDDETEIKAAKDAYDALTPAQQNLVSQDAITKLQAVEAKLDEKKIDAAKTAAKTVLSTYRSEKDATLYDDAGIQAMDTAKADGDTAIDEATTTVAVAAALQNAKDNIDAVKTKDQKAAANVEELIDALPASDSITLDNAESYKEAINNAVDAYDALTETQKALVNENKKQNLESVKAALDLALSKKTALAVLEAFRDNKEDSLYDQDGVAALNNAETAGAEAINTATTIEAVQAALDVATTNINAVKTKDQKAANYVISLIDALPEPVKITWKNIGDYQNDMRFAEQAFNRLTDNQRALINDDRQKKLEGMYIAETVADTINRIIETTITGRNWFKNALYDEYGIAELDAIKDKYLDEAKLLQWDGTKESAQEIIETEREIAINVRKEFYAVDTISQKNAKAELEAKYDAMKNSGDYDEEGLDELKDAYDTAVEAIDAATVSDTKDDPKEKGAWQAEQEGEEALDAVKTKEEKDKEAAAKVLSEISAKTGDDTYYTGKQVELVNKPTTSLPDGYTLEYAVSTSNTEPASGWSTKTPAATEIGSYNVWCRVVEDKKNKVVASKNLTADINAKPSKGTITTDGIYCASNYPSIQAGISIHKSNENDRVEYRWVACDSGKPGEWFEVSPWTKDNNCIDWTPEKSGEYVIVCYARVVGNEKDSEIQYAFGTEYHKGIKGICQIPYTGEGGGYLIGIESYNNPNNSYQYEMLILDCTLYAQGKDAWIYTTGKCASLSNCLWTIWQPKYGYYWTLFRIYDSNGNLLDEECFGFANVN